MGNLPSLFHSLSLGGSSKRRKSDEDDKSLDYASCSKKRKVNEEPLVVPKNAEAISIDEDEEGSEQCDQKSFNGCVDVENEVKSDDSREHGEIDAKDETFVDEKCDEEEEHSVGSDSDDADDEEEDGDNKEIVDDESEENEISDEDFKVDELNEISDNDDDSSCGSPYVYKKRKGYRKDKFEHAGHASVSSSKLNEVSETLKAKSVEVKVKNVSDESMNAKSKDNVGDSDVGKDLCIKGLDVGRVSSVQTKQEKKKESDKQKMMESKGRDNNSLMESKKRGRNQISTLFRHDTRPPSVSVETPHERIWSLKKVQKVQKTKEDEVNEVLWDELDTSLRESEAVSKNEASEEQKAKIVKNVSDVAKAKSKYKVKAKDNAKPNVIVNVADSDEGKEQYVKALGVGGVSSVQTKQEKMKESYEKKMIESNGRDYKGRANICIEKKESIDKKNGLNQRVESTHYMRKELRSLELLAKCYLERKNTMKNDSTVLEVNGDGIDRKDTQPPPVSVQTPPERIWSLKKVEIVQKTKEQEELEPLWDQVDIYVREEYAVSTIGNYEAEQENMGDPSHLCEHDTRLDDEIGVYCRLCGVVITEIKYISQPVCDTVHNEGSRERTSFDDSANSSLFHGSLFNVSNGDSDGNFFHKEGTVWDLIPGVKQTLYPHQEEGFEFIWKNLAGNTNLQKLKNADLCSEEGGCIISHAPGTGKTRVTIVFLKAYLKVFPECLPVIIAPASLLRTWEDEFKKWDIGFPFHNLNNPKLSGKEHDDAINLFNWSNTRHSVDTMRTVKLISWYKEKSILGISYSLYEKLAGGGGESDDEGGEDEKKKKEIMGNVLRETPGLLVLDEGHTPRNKKSSIWQVLSEVQTPKRIILSGTPFQNNFMELYNTLSLVKPSFPNTIPQELKKFCQKKNHKKASKEWIWEDKIKQLKLLMDPFVHVHKGAILQKKLRGLRNCVLRLKPDRFHKKILERIQSSQNTLIFEGKETRVSVHPSLLLEEEESVLDKERLEKLRLNPYAGVKTKFLVKFVSLCAANNEKVLVFSQFLSPLRLIRDQLLNSFLKWTMDKEILYMYGEVKDRQSLIDRFNDRNSQAKILLASTRSCSEGISLVGASRVVLLDVVWNPSVEKQAISRAYRIGQKKPVYTYHLLTEGTRECDKFCKQAEKERLSDLVFSEKKEDNNDELRSCAANTEDEILDKMKRHKMLKNMFVECLVQPKEREFESFGY